MNIFDTHFHINANDDLELVHANAKKAGVDLLFVAGTTVKETENLLNRISPFPNIYTAIGVHPHDAENFDTMTLFQNKIDNPSVKAVGEIGLDYFYDNAPKETQIRVFESFLKFANEQQLPIIVHCREAFDDCYTIIKDQFDCNLKFVIHCFTGSADWAMKFIKLGGYLSFNGIITFKKSEEIRSVLKKLPLDRILFETDSPYLAPVPYRGKKNEPSYMPYIIEKAADVLGMSYDELIQISTSNGKTFYSID